MNHPVAQAYKDVIFRNNLALRRLSRHSEILLAEYATSIVERVFSWSETYPAKQGNPYMSRDESASSPSIVHVQEWYIYRSTRYVQHQTNDVTPLGLQPRCEDKALGIKVKFFAGFCTHCSVKRANNAYVSLWTGILGSFARSYMNTPPHVSLRSCTALRRVVGSLDLTATIVIGWSSSVWRSEPTIGSCFFCLYFRHMLPSPF